MKNRTTSLLSKTYLNKYSKVLFTIFLTIFLLDSCKKSTNLTTEEKIADFNFLYAQLEQSYPYFEVNKRVNQVDWLANRDQYIDIIKNTDNDQAYYKALTSILNELNSDHTDTYPTIIYNYFYDGYKAASKKDSTYISFVKELEKTDTLRTKYWANIDKTISSNSNTDNETDNTTEETPENIKTVFYDSISTAYVNIKSFSYEYIKNDADTLKQFFNRVYDFDNLIIDIQGNGGGDTTYWTNNIVPHLIKDSIMLTSIYAFKKSDRLMKFKPDYFKSIKTYKEYTLPNMPDELKSGEYLFKESDMIIHSASNRKYYKGSIYLLVDNGVFSSAETLAYFCKATNFATVAGITTNGDGVGTDPLLVTLPKSGIVVRFTGEMGLNPDGSSNEEKKTVPNLKIEAPSEKERINKLVTYISNISKN